MDKNLLIQVLRQHTTASGEEARQIIALKKEFPFSQVLHAISARVSKEYNFDFQQSELQQAAVYATDRSVLKQIMTVEINAAPQVQVTKTFVAPAEVVMKAESIKAEVSAQPIQKPESTEQKPAAQQTADKDRLVVYEEIDRTIEHVDLADAVLKDLEKLNRLKHNFEMLFVDQAASTPISSTIQHTVPDHATDEHDQPHKSKRARIIELARAMNNTPDTSTPSSFRKKRNNQEELIEDIKTNKEEIEPGTERLKEQIEIIDQFIKTQPSITAVKDKNPLPPTDLNSVKSGEFGDNIVSETLVEILIKQGKKDRAIEVLKKLIWKYPQKKAYFASQIEDLKK